MKPVAIKRVCFAIAAGSDETPRIGPLTFAVEANDTLLNREIIKIVALPDIKEKMAALGFEAVGNSPAEASALFRSENIKWAKVIREAGIKAH